MLSYDALTSDDTDTGPEGRLRALGRHDDAAVDRRQRGLTAPSSTARHLTARTSSSTPTSRLPASDTDGIADVYERFGRHDHAGLERADQRQRRIRPHLQGRLAGREPRLLPDERAADGVGHRHLPRRLRALGRHDDEVVARAERRERRRSMRNSPGLRGRLEGLAGDQGAARQRRHGRALRGRGRAVHPAVSRRVRALREAARPWSPRAGTDPTRPPSPPRRRTARMSSSTRPSQLTADDNPTTRSTSTTAPGGTRHWFSRR